MRHHQHHQHGHHNNHMNNHHNNNRRFVPPAAPANAMQHKKPMMSHHGHHHHNADAGVAPSQYSYEEFCQRPIYVLDQLYKGTFYAASGVYQGSTIEFRQYAPPITPPGTLIKPHTELWNVYWETFFAKVAHHLDAIKTFLSLNNQVEGIYNTKERVPSSRRVVVKCPGSLLFAAADDESGYPADLRAFTQLSEAFGAVTDVNLTETEVHVTYTAPRSAEMFSEYLRQTGFRLADGMQNMGGINTFPAAPNNRDGMSCLLKLGPHVDIGLPYVTALFGEIFEARVEFIAAESSYLIKFKDSDAARFCHHILHQSFFKVFGLALVVVRIKTSADAAEQVRRGDWDIPYHALRAV